MKSIKHTLKSLQHSDGGIGNQSIEVSALRKRGVGYKQQLTLLQKIKSLRHSRKQVAKILKDIS